MKRNPMISNPYKLLQYLTAALLGLLIAWAAIMAFFPVRPFWIDEWRLLGNLKLKTAAELWGPLDYTQQFPRVFLQVLKRATAAFDYSYTSLRLPSLIISLGTISLSLHLRRRLFPNTGYNSFLFILILVSYQTFTEYIVQIKQYEMELFLGLLAVWQLLSLLELSQQKARASTYLLLCLSLALGPFFSYTYAIAMAPVYTVVAAQFLLQPKKQTRVVLLQAFPLLLNMTAILWFYKIDAAQLMHDEHMHQYWAYRMADGLQPGKVAENIWRLFANIGSGLLFEIIFSILGIGAFFGAFAAGSGSIRRRSVSNQALMDIYCISVVLLAIALLLMGKLPAGEPKFSSFTAPAIILLIVGRLEQLRQKQRTAKLAAGISIVLVLGLTGNILSTIFNSFTRPEYAQRIATYKATEAAIRQAQAAGLPMLVTTGVAYPDDIAKETPHLVTVTADVVLRTFPAYNVAQSIPVYALQDMSQADSLMQQKGIQRAIVGNGLHYALKELPRQ